MYKIEMNKWNEQIALWMNMFSKRFLKEIKNLSRILQIKRNRQKQKNYRKASSRGAYGHDPFEVFLKSIDLIPQQQILQLHYLYYR